MDHIDDRDKYQDVEPGATGLNPKDLVGAKKAPLGLVPPALEIGAAEAMAIGAEKYGPFNWRDQPIQYMTYLEAMKRHLDALIDGQDLAEDTGVHHLKHVVAGGGILLDALAIPGGVVDNRPPKGPAADLLRAQDKTALRHRPLAGNHAVDPAGCWCWFKGVDGTEGGDVVAGDLIGCDPTTCSSSECGIHSPALGAA